jgi:lipoate-protein ligase A
MDRWLFLDSGPASGAENMALDEMLLERAERDGGAPVLRLYSFDPPAITIGAHQDPLDTLDFDAVRADGLDCVRRITGGRALLHEGELTYCVVAPVGTAVFAGGRAEAFMKISEALRAAIRSLGAAAEVSRGREGPRPRGAAPPCLSSATRAELTVGARKIAGSAQRTTARAFLQHGSILARPGSERIVKYLRGSWDSLAARVTSLEGELGRPVDDRELRAAVLDGFSELFDVAWAPLRLSDLDLEAIAARATEKRREMRERAGREVSSP